MYILELKHLLPGDIILTREEPEGKSFKELKAKLQSRTIRNRIKGNYSHVMLYVGSGSYIHSNTNGVHAGSLNRCIFNSPSDVKVLRSAATPLDISNAIIFARNQVGKEYDVFEAVGSVFPRFKGKDNRQFCSRLVAQSFDFANVPLTKKPNQATPACVEFSPIVHKPFYMVRTPEPEEQKILDEGSFYLSEQNRITNELLRTAREITKQDIQTPEDLIQTAFRNQKFDSGLAEVINKTGYLNLYENEISKNLYRYDIHAFEKKYCLHSSEYISQLAHSEMSIAVSNFNRFTQQYNQYITFKNQRVCINLMIELYSKLMSFSIRHRDVMREMLARTN